MERQRTNHESDFEQTKRFLNAHNNSIALIFHRHAEHDNDRSKPDEIKPLSINTDIERTLELSGVIDNDLTVAYSFDTLRSFLTSYYLLNPEDPIELDPDAQILRYQDIKSGDMRTKIRASNELNYKDATDTAFFEGLVKAYVESKTLDFHVNHSDQYVEKGEDISSYTVVSRDIRNIIQKYLKVIPRWQELSQEKYDNRNLYRTFCAREMIYGCFRAKVTELVSGLEARDSFVSHYDATVRDKRTGVILIKDAENIVLKDGFDELNVPVSCLDRI